MAEELTDDEKLTLKTAAFGAVFLVSNIDPGFLAVLRESFAASGALAGATGLTKEVLTTGSMPHLPRVPLAEVEGTVLPAVRRSVAILRAKAPEELDNYRATVTGAMNRVAGAVSGISEGERAMIAKVTVALDG